MTGHEDLCEVPARVLASKLRRKELSAAEALELHLGRIEQRNPALTAVVSLDAGRARKLAAEADAALRRGEVRGPLHGVPMTLKDGHDVAGLRTTLGTAELDRIADEDGTVAARLRAAGAIIIGHTNVPPWLADYQSRNPIFGRTSNPWDTERTAGGSSGGAAAALAAGMTPLEVSSDLAGSARLPAHFCGVYGLKTTEHRVPLTGFFRPPPGVPRSVRIMSTLGPMARDLGDLELALAIIAGPDGRDSDVPPVPLVPRARRRLEDLRLAFAPVLPGARVARAVRYQVERVAAQASDAGVRVVERVPDLDWEALLRLFGDLLDTTTGIFAPGAELRDEQRTLAWYLDALERRDRFIDAWQAFFADLDGLVVPPAMTSAFPHTEPYGQVHVDGASVSYSEHGRLLAFCNLAGLPALAVPAGIDGDGLPIGVQIVGPRWSEVGLLEIGRELEEAGILPGFQPPPNPPA
ncbi:MAG TPA: amidase family protein [Candidatus Acidoferrum sp.]|nr:amidase family protein [Candidatus Acidoferrum sp.]